MKDPEVWGEDMEPPYHRGVPRLDAGNGGLG